MKKSRKILIVLFAVAVLLAYGVYWAFFDIQRIEGQQMLDSVDSPDGRYTVISYLNNGGATVDYAALCVIRDNQTRKQRNIYWQYEAQTADIIHTLRF